MMMRVSVKFLVFPFYLNEKKIYKKNWNDDDDSRQIERKEALKPF